MKVKFNLKNWRILLSYDRWKVYDWFAGFEAELREKYDIQSENGKLFPTVSIKEILGE